MKSVVEILEMLGESDLASVGMHPGWLQLRQPGATVDIVIKLPQPNAVLLVGMNSKLELWVTPEEFEVIQQAAII